jgi:hypothetical protein
MPSAPMKSLHHRRRNGKIGLTPKIIIFSDKKDLIRVSLDSDESDEDADIAHLSYDHRFHVKTKSSRRRSIAGNNSGDLSSSSENLAADTEIDEGQGDLVDVKSSDKDEMKAQEKGYENPAFEPDEGATPKGKIETEVVKDEVASVPQKSSQKEKPQRPKSAKPKKPASPPNVAGASDDGNKKNAKKKAGSSSGVRPKSAKPGLLQQPEGRKKKAESVKGMAERNKDDIEEEGEEGAVGTDDEKKARPHTGIDRWSTKEVQNMSKIVAWDRPEDDI